jgi:hypothetical protein
MMTNRQEQIIVNKWAALLRLLKRDICDDYRCTDDPDDNTPGMVVTFGLDSDGGWSYQTGDNSFSGGAYGYVYWGVAYLNRRSNCKDLAREAFNDAAEQMYEAQS